MPVRVLQRCSVYGFWPQYKLLRSEPFEVPIGSIGRSVSAQLCLQTYKNRESYNQAPEIALNALKYGYPSMERSIGFYIGDTMFSEKKGDVLGNLTIHPPYEGDIDVYAEVDTEIAESEIQKALAPLVHIYVLSLIVKSDDLIAPKLDAKAFRLDANHALFDVTVNMGGTRARSQVPFNELKNYMNEFNDLSRTLTSEETLCVGAAARRIINATNEVDLIDKFCDYWEACEFLCSRPHLLAVKDKSMRVAKELSSIIGYRQDDIWETITKPIYEFRNEVVHEFLYREQEMRPMLSILKDVTYKLFSERVGAKINPLGELHDYLTKVQSGEMKPMQRVDGPKNYKLKT